MGNRRSYFLRNLSQVRKMHTMAPGKQENPQQTLYKTRQGGGGLFSGLKVCVSSNSYVEALIFNVAVFGDRTSKKAITVDEVIGWSPDLIQLPILQEETPEIPLSLLSTEEMSCEHSQMGTFYCCPQREKRACTRI